jgi:hypothetical protein
MSHSSHRFVHMPFKFSDEIEFILHLENFMKWYYNQFN